MSRAGGNRYPVWGRTPWLVLTAIGLAGLAVVNLGPLALVVRQAITPETLWEGWPLPLWPRRTGLDNFAQIWAERELATHLWRSLGVALGTTLASLAIGFPAGWAATRWSRLGPWMTRMALISRILPPIAIAIPLAALMIPLGLYDHPLGLGLILAHMTIGVPLAILIGAVAFRDIPAQLEEAAMIDGCSTFSAFWRISLPSARGGVGAAFILIFLASWDELTYALLIQSTHPTIPPLIYQYTAQSVAMGPASALALFMLIPAIAVIAIFQRLLTKGLLSGGLNQ